MDTQVTYPNSSPGKTKSFSGVLSGSQREELERHGVEFDENGQPVWYTVPEWFDKLDQKLIEHFGEEYRDLANKRRLQWNRLGRWRFRQL